MGQLLNNHVAVETDLNVRHFDREGLCQLPMLDYSCNYDASVVTRIIYISGMYIFWLLRVIL